MTVSQGLPERPVIALYWAAVALLLAGLYVLLDRVPDDSWKRINLLLRQFVLFLFFLTFVLGLIAMLCTN